MYTSIFIVSMHTQAYDYIENLLLISAMYWINEPRELYDYVRFSCIYGNILKTVEIYLYCSNVINTQLLLFEMPYWHNL